MDKEKKKRQQAKEENAKRKWRETIPKAERKTDKYNNDDNDSVKDMVISISNVALSEVERLLCLKVSRFASDLQRSKFHLLHNIKQFSRRLRLYEYFW